MDGAAYEEEEPEGKPQKDDDDEEEDDDDSELVLRGNWLTYNQLDLKALDILISHMQGLPEGVSSQSFGWVFRRRVNGTKGKIAKGHDQETKDKYLLYGALWVTSLHDNKGYVHE